MNGFQIILRHSQGLVEGSGAVVEEGDDHDGVFGSGAVVGCGDYHQLYLHKNPGGYERPAHFVRGFPALDLGKGGGEIAGE